MMLGECIIEDWIPWPAFSVISSVLPLLTSAGEEREARAGWGREESGIRVHLPRLAPFPGSHHEGARSCAGAL